MKLCCFPAQREKLIEALGVEKSMTSSCTTALLNLLIYIEEPTEKSLSPALRPLWRSRELQRECIEYIKKFLKIKKIIFELLALHCLAV